MSISLPLSRYTLILPSFLSNINQEAIRSAVTAYALQSRAVTESGSKHAEVDSSLAHFDV
ncbi:MAG: hypothetical protein C4326_08795 [Ignavibacteria bacterium]